MIDFKRTIKLWFSGKNRNSSVEVDAGENICPVCGNEKISFKQLPRYYLQKWQEYQLIHSIFQLETLNITNYSCPKCNASDRDRLYSLFLNKKKDHLINKRLLDFAPSVPLSRFIRNNIQVEYRTADLLMAGVDDQVDITNMQIYEDESFDAFICSHILEHIANDHKAIKELFRILRGGGWGIIMVPIHLGLEEDYENLSVQDEKGRWRHFMQGDHVRVYSKLGFLSKLKQNGFRVNSYDVNYFGVDTFKLYGIQERSVLYVVSK